MGNIWIALVTGLTTGGVSCLAVQGGLLASSTSQLESDISKKQKAGYIAAFLGSKIVAYTILGFFLGLLGSAIAITPTLQGWLQILAGLFMLATAARLANLHPIFRYAVIEPPKWAFRILRTESKNSGFFANIVLGAATVLIPCGVTQSMMVLAVATGNPLLGSLIMAAFTIGTSPVFFALGFAFVELLKKKVFSYIAALAIFVMATISVNTGQVLRGSPHTLQNYWKLAFGQVETANAKGLPQIKNGKQEVTINVTNEGYVSDIQTVKAGVPVKLKLITENVKSCARAFSIPTFNVSKVLPQTGVEVVEFTPTQTGRLAYTCSMGMFSGSFTVIQ